jgi:hypothetical protein
VIPGAKQDEGQAETSAKANQQTTPATGIPQENVAEAKTRRHDRDPGEERIGDKKERAMNRESGLAVKNVPERGQAAETVRRQRIEQVVRQNDDQAQRGEDPDGQVNQSGEDDHRQTQHPEDGENEDCAGPVPLQEQEEAQHGELEEHEPESAGEEEAGEFRPRAAAAMPEKCSDAGGEGEDRRAEVGDPAGGEKGGRGAGKIGRRERHGGGAGEVAHMVEGHDDDDGATQGVYGLKAS